MAVTQKARDLQAAGRDVLTLSMGELDFETPAPVKEAAIAAIAAGETRYTAVDGTPALKAAITEKYRRDHDFLLSPEEIVATTGGKFLIYAALRATLEPGDEVIIPSPYWVSYPGIVRMCGAVPVILATQAGQGFLPDPQTLKATMTPKTRWILLNFPNNPSGATLPLEHAAALAEVIEAHPRALVLSDDIYELIRFDASPPGPLFAKMKGMRERTLTVNGVSKSHAMTGWRLGFGAGPAPLMAAIRRVAGQTTSNPCSISQAAAVAALGMEPSFLTDWRTALRTRRDLVVRTLNRIEGISCLSPSGAFYVFPDINGVVKRKGLADDTAFCTALLDEEALALVPGSAFGAPGFVRLSFAAADSVLEEAMGRLKRFCA
ncbi:aspartate aminotransferase A [Parvularcula bermudensis HTCC2503]|uniref:Aminotransferase n=2 Tax=Parvularcula TaxID=208215 RepID=E0TB33_PARBH|nr:aspartate aminotransferase A [Parvularcula bermudensis HTCC2503]